MASFLAKVLFKKLGFNDPKNDPRFVQVEKPRLGRSTGKMVWERRSEDDCLKYISDEDRKIYKSVKRWSRTMDSSCCNMLGLAFFIGLIPVVGDLLCTFIAINIYFKCRRVKGMDWKTKGAMKWNLWMDFGIGLVPVFGDLVDTAYKANTRNKETLEMFLTKKSDRIRDEEREKAALVGQSERTQQYMAVQQPSRAHTNYSVHDNGHLGAPPRYEPLPQTAPARATQTKPIRTTNEKSKAGAWLEQAKVKAGWQTQGRDLINRDPEMGERNALPEHPRTRI